VPAAHRLTLADLASREDRRAALGVSPDWRRNHQAGQLGGRTMPANVPQMSGVIPRCDEKPDPTRHRVSHTAR
jgi:hypothetical protein